MSDVGFFGDQRKTATAWQRRFCSSSVFTILPFFAHYLYSLDVTLSDYHLSDLNVFYLKSDIDDNQIQLYGREQKALRVVLENDKMVCKNVIMKFPERWQDIMEQNGKYVVQ